MSAYEGNFLSGPEVLDPGFDYKYAVLYPHGSNIGIENGRLTPRLTKLSEIAVDGAIELRKRRPDVTIVVPGESAFGRPDTGDLMVERALETSDVPKDAFWLLHKTAKGKGLTNTYRQSQAVVEELGNEADDTVGVTDWYHWPRAKASLEALGMWLPFTTAESLLHARGIREHDRYLDLIDTLRDTTEQRAKKLTDDIHLPKGQLINALMVLTGPRIVDIIEHEDGELELENSFSRIKKPGLVLQLGLMQLRGVFRDSAA